MKPPKPASDNPARWSVYILECADRTLYTGITTDLDRRIQEHDSGKGAKYTRGRAPVTLLYSEFYDSRGTALKREAEIKSLDRTAKRQLAQLSGGRISCTQT